ncbi:MAG: EVE domain-containing protein [Rhodocyclaceae bacterium UTPRO2]|nr:MAG: EVE domain-containing protein [Rhodocyclaceae bacterium UTPRO2]
MRYWLMKSEPEAYGIDDLVRDKVTAWWGVRNYQARNFMRDQMRPGVGVLLFASPDATQFDRKHKYFDPKSSPDNPRWLNVDVKLVKKTPLVSLAELRSHKELANMRTLAKGNRLSITPVDPAEWKFITEQLMGMKK